MKNQKNIIIAIVVLIISSVFFLGAVEYRQHNGKDSQGWWSVYFASPYDSKSLNFVIENYDEKTDFTYEVLANDEVVKSESVMVKSGEENAKLIELDVEKVEGETFEIRAFDGKKSKSVYKR